MHVTAVESTTLATVGYDEARQVLQLEFRSRAIYHYFNVPAAVHQALLGAPSIGSYFNRFIRGRFPYSPVEGVPSALASECRGSEILWHGR